ncbi:MAG: triose-phosphate isomerase [Candidatus Nanoarchaeia archaeon]
MITIINFKTYKQGEQVLKLAKIIEKIDQEIIIAVPASDVKNVKIHSKIRVFAQHVDYFEKGRNTGFIIPESVKAQGADGTLLNHSEHKLEFNVLKKTIKRCKDVGLKTAVFAADLSEARKIEKLNPDFLIIEPPELVAGKISVSSARPDLIKKISEAIGMKFLVGAGIHNGKDVEIALKLGASGIAVSSAITESRNPSRDLEKLIGK